MNEEENSEVRSRKYSGKRSATRYECGFFNEGESQPNGPCTPKREGRGGIFFKKEEVDLFVPAVSSDYVVGEKPENKEKNVVIKKRIKSLLLKKIDKAAVVVIDSNGVFFNKALKLDRLNNGKWFEAEKPMYDDPSKTECIQYLVNELDPYLSDDNLHQLISVLMEYEIRNSNPFRGTSLCKAMVYLELMRHHTGEAFNLQPLFRHLVKHDVRNNSRQADAENTESDFVRFIIFNVFNRHMDEQEAILFCELFNKFSEQYTVDKLPPLTSSDVKAKDIAGLKQAYSLEKKNSVTKLFDGVKKKFVNAAVGHRNTY